jgi:hypothetical protein
MAKGRFLSKSVSTSKKLANLKSDSTRLLWTWILPHLDREGRFHADFGIIKGHAVPRLKNHTEKTIEADLMELSKSGLVLLYEVGGDRYLQFTQFDENQPGMRKDREAESQCPPPPMELLIKSGEGPELVGEESKQALILKLKLELKLKEEKQSKDFDAFWEKYPRKVEKTPAFEAYVSALKEATPDDLLKALDGYLADIAENKTEKKYIKHPATFLHKNRWRDYLDRPAKVKKTLRVLQRDGSYENVEVEE